DVRVPSPPNHQEVQLCVSHFRERGAKIRKKHDVAIRITEKVVLGQGLGALEHGADQNGAELVFADVRLVAYAKISGGFGIALLVAKQNDLHAGMEKRPALQRVPLNHVEVSAEGLGGGEDRQHECPTRARIASRFSAGMATKFPTKGSPVLTNAL